RPPGLAPACGSRARWWCHSPRSPCHSSSPSPSHPGRPGRRRSRPTRTATRSRACNATTPPMKILHTSDWHIGKRLGRHDRMGEFGEVLAEVEAIADERAVDLVLVSGDIWDRPMPPTDALHLGLQTLLRLAQGRPVVAVAGNHDSAGLFEALAPLLRPLGVFLIGDVKRPDQGALL